MTQTTTLTDFLLARIAEEKAVAEAAIEPDQLYPWGDRTLPRRRPEDVPDDVRGYLGGTWGEHFARHDPARVLADCEAKRRIVELHANAGEGDCGWASDPCPTLRLLALPCASHPDYRQEWKP